MIFALLLFGLGLFVPRLTILFLWLLTDWFTGVFGVWLWPVIGFIFAPYSLLWYSVVQNAFGGSWGPLQIVGLLLALILDLSAGGFGYRRYYHHNGHVDVVDEAVV